MSARYNYHWLIECVEPANNHDKYYQSWLVNVSPTEYLCVFNWGRRGGKGQQQILSGTESEMRNAMARKYSSKTSSGYTTIVPPNNADGWLPETIDLTLAATPPEMPETTTLVLSPARVRVEMGDFVQALLGAVEVTPAMVTARTTFNQQMEDLRRALDEAEATASLMDVVYKKRLG